MKFQVLPLVLALNAVAVSALKIPFQQTKRSPLQRRGGGAAVSVSHPSAKFANKGVLAAAASSDGSDDSTFGTKYVDSLSQSY